MPLAAPALLPCCPLPPQALVPHPQVTATVCREGALREVAVRLGVESALGTTSVVHFCGAQFQVLPRPFDLPLSMAPTALVLVCRRCVPA